MKLYRHFKAGSDLIRLDKKHTAGDSADLVDQFERLMVAGQFPGHERYLDWGCAGASIRLISGRAGSSCLT